MGEHMLHELSSGYSSNLKKVRRTKLVLHWANFCFAILVRDIRRTVTKLCSRSKKLRSSCSGSIRPSSANLASD